ncbi:hypothetical protein [Silvimonas iriomotensis]|uniref:Lipoprotein n=1 Tax=Silvimonas iriomotensis TaxID=449662 RepID=A0ABQ2PCM1_9NEIS|nr:hypothetical protein [Silvimonas iriomotensis]GGP23207.1 hypothetical protein GCM10010970_32070 [Silvimonas iriomotensis]
MKKLIQTLSLTACATLALSACNKPAEKPSAEVFTSGMNQYLAQKGHFCLDKTDWPINITPNQAAAAERDAVQLPVLQQMGIVAEKDVMVRYDSPGKSEVISTHQYSLTPEGQKYYLKQDFTYARPDGSKATRHGDLCAASLTLDQIVGWEPPHDENGHPTTAVTYTYKVDAAPWAKDPAMVRVFPMLARIVQGDRQMQLKEVFTLTDKGWKSVDLM